MESWMVRAQKYICVALSIVVCILCYRSTTAILRLARQANNPTEGRIPAEGDRLEVRENKPRPAKQQFVTRIFRMKDEVLIAAPDPLLHRQPEQADLRPVTAADGSAEAIAQESRPKYLLLYLPAASNTSAGIPEQWLRRNHRRP